MRDIYSYIVLLSIVLITACTKEVEESTEAGATFIKVVQVDETYYARDVLQLSSGAIVVGAVAPIIGTFSEQLNPSSESPSILVKYSESGELLWQLTLPESVHVLWQAIELEDGNIAVAGFNSEDNSNQIGLAIISRDAEILSQTSIFNITNKPPIFRENHVDIIQLNNGELAMAASTSNLGGGTSFVAIRLMIFDLLLNKTFDRIYSKDAIVPSRSPIQASLAESQNGDLFINGRDFRTTTLDSLAKFAFCLKLASGSYDPIYHQLFETTESESPSSLTISDDDKFVWASCPSLPKDSIYSNIFNLRNQEVFAIGPKATLWITDGIDSNSRKLEFSGYPKYGYIKQVIRTADGGYMLFGTCNINANQLLTSDYKIMMIKLDRNFQKEWIKYPSENSQSIASDIIETNNGYILSGVHHSLGEISKPIIFKTDLKGDLN